MRCFKNIAKLVRTRRLQHPKGYSQSELSNMLGYKNGQFISNVERALCNVPLKMLVKIADVLDIPAQDLKVAILKDHEETLNNYLKINDEEKASSSGVSQSSHATMEASSRSEFSSTPSFKLSQNS